MCVSFDSMRMWMAGIGVGRLGCLMSRYFCCVCLMLSVKSCPSMTLGDFRELLVDCLCCSTLCMEHKYFQPVSV